MIFIDYFTPTDIPVEYNWRGGFVAVYDTHIPTTYEVITKFVVTFDYNVMPDDKHECLLNQMRFIFVLTKVRVL